MTWASMPSMMENTDAICSGKIAVAERFQCSRQDFLTLQNRGTFFPGLEGFEEIQNPDIEIFRMHVPDIAAFTEAGHKPGETVICTGKIKHVGSTYIDQWNYVKSILPADKVASAKLTLAAPNWVSSA